MHCSSCAVPMEALTLRTHLGAPVTIDVCWPCHLIWFDHMESTSLAPESVIELFRRIHAARNEGRNIVKLQTGCPHCSTRLAAASDIAKGGRFNYSRCPSGHGRLIAFAQFLREKSFVRTLAPQEVERLAVSVKQIRCSSCGGPIDLEADKACRHCGSAISVLDEAAVEKALNALHEKSARQRAPDPAAQAQAILDAQRNASRNRTARFDPCDGLERTPRDGKLTDLVEVGVAAALAILANF